MEIKRYKIVYCTPALYMAGGVERVLTLKANYFAERYDYDITIILTEGRGKPLFYPLSERVKVVNLDLNFEELWSCSFIKKIFVYLKKQRQYKRLLTDELMRIRPDITVSLLRREINFITKIKDGSKKVGELHINRANYRNFEDRNPIKQLFSRMWMRSLVSKLRQLDRLVVLTDNDRKAWVELTNVVAIPNPLSFTPSTISQLSEKRVIAVGRYCHEKGYDHLLKAWALVVKACPDWRLEVFGDGDKSIYTKMMDELHLNRHSCILNDRTKDIETEYLNSSLAVCSSRFEGFGLTLVEAMACGLPVVSFDCPWGPREIVQDGEDGFLVNNGDIVKLAEALITLIEDSGLRVRMSTKAVKNVSRFAMEQIAIMWKSLFESL